MGRGGFYFDVVAAVVRRWGDYLLEEGRDSGAGLFGDSRTAMLWLAIGGQGALCAEGLYVAHLVFEICLRVLS